MDRRGCATIGVALFFVETTETLEEIFLLTIVSRDVGYIFTALLCILIFYDSLFEFLPWISIVQFFHK
jgi:hypothetical protein